MAQSKTCILAISVGRDASTPPEFRFAALRAPLSMTMAFGDCRGPVTLLADRPMPKAFNFQRTRAYVSEFQTNLASVNAYRR